MAIVLRPEFVFIVQGEKKSALRRDGEGYTRWAGNWRVGARVVDGRLVAVGSGPMAHATGALLIETTREEWAKDNGVKL